MCSRIPKVGAVITLDCARAARRHAPPSRARAGAAIPGAGIRVRPCGRPGSLATLIALRGHLVVMRRMHQRSVGAGDQQQDAHVVQPGQQVLRGCPAVTGGRPRTPRTGRYHHAVHGGGEPGRPRRGEGDEHDASGRGDRESAGVQHAPEPGRGSTRPTRTCQPRRRQHPRCLCHPRYPRHPAPNGSRLLNPNLRYRKLPDSRSVAGSDATWYARRRPSLEGHRRHRPSIGSAGTVSGNYRQVSAHGHAPRVPACGPVARQRAIASRDSAARGPLRLGYVPARSTCPDGTRHTGSSPAPSGTERHVLRPGADRLDLAPPVLSWAASGGGTRG